MARRRPAGAATLAVAAAAIACGTDARPADTPQSEARLSGEILVSAAASLTDAFIAVERTFEAANPGVDVVLNLAGSSSLAAQILDGAPVDVFASASRTNMQDVVAAGAISGEPRVFARNRLQIAVPAGNSSGVRGLGDFARPDLRIGLCAEPVPCGAAARRLLAQAGVVPSIDTDEPNVRALLTKIELGELDAGITYVTDVASTHGSVQGLDLPVGSESATEYVIGVLGEAPNRPAADELVRFILSHDGRAILSRAGFER